MRKQGTTRIAAILADVKSKRVELVCMRRTPEQDCQAFIKLAGA